MTRFVLERDQTSWWCILSSVVAIPQFGFPPPSRPPGQGHATTECLEDSNNAECSSTQSCEAALGAVTDERCRTFDCLAFLGFLGTMGIFIDEMEGAPGQRPVLQGGQGTRFEEQGSFQAPRSRTIQ